MRSIWLSILIILTKTWNNDLVMAQGDFNSYPPPNLDQLTPLTITWNQVHYLVRQNLLDVDMLRKEHEQLYTELQQCFGLEDCLTAANLVDASVATTGANYETGSLLEQLQREREQLLSSNSGSMRDAEMRERQRIEQWQRQQQQQRRGQQQGQQQGQRGYTYSYSYQYGSEVNRNREEQGDWQRSSDNRYGGSLPHRG